MRALAHQLTWQAPRPLWRGTTPFVAAPQILRFASDDFMEQAIATLAHEPARISERIAKPETWRTPASQTDIADMVPRVPLPAPVVEAKRRRLLGSRPAPPPPPVDPKAPLKLYQPAHQRYYLIAGSLACAIPGLPERAVAGGHENVHFVVRRLMPRTAESETNTRPDAPPSPAEFAYVKSGDDATWQLIESGTDLAPGEELLPLFPLTHHDENGMSRTLWSGLIPVARREDYLGKPVSRTIVPLAQGQIAALRPPQPALRKDSITARTAQLRVEVSEPWKAMVRMAIKAADEFKLDAAANPKETEAQRRKRVLDYHYQFQMQSWLLLLDLRAWIDEFLKPLSAVLALPAAGNIPPKQLEVWNWLDRTNAEVLLGGMPNLSIAVPATATVPAHTVVRNMALTLRTALARIGAFKDRLDNARLQYGAKTLTDAAWPDFHFPLAGLRLPTLPSPEEPNPLFAPAIADGPFKAVNTLDPPGNAVDENPQITDPTGVTGTNNEAEKLDRFTALLARALVPDTEADVQPIPYALKLRDTMIKTAGDPGLFVIRMVHINADCGPLHPPTLSAPSVRFRLASFFDPDAPVRPITITLPVDTSPAGLRKHGRGTAFVMSDLLCGQVQRAKGLGFIDLVLQVLPWPFHKDIDIGTGGGCKNNDLEIGMICSLSIPIITLCALILLIIIVTLLDMIFRWLPWFIACFPVPKLKGKPSS